MPCWDPSLIFINLPIQNPPGNLVILPYEIDRPVVVNVNQQPSFSRSRLFEFVLNGPGQSLPVSGWQWFDRAPVPYQKFITTPVTLTISSDAGAADAGLQISSLVTIADPNNLSSSGYIEQPDLWTLNGSGTFTTVQSIADLRQVYINPLLPSGAARTGNISVTPPGGTIIAYWPVWVSKPEYAIIKISQTGYSVVILGRRKNFKVAVPTDWIPLTDETALITMVQAIKMLEELNYTAYATALAAATSFQQNDQAIKMAAFAAAAGNQVQTPLNLDIIARDVLQVNDIYDEFCAIYGQIGQQKIFDAITECIEGLGNQSEWDPLIGYVDILVQNLEAPYVTLPRDVEIPLAININGKPSNFGSKWLEFNLNGPGEAEIFSPENTLTPLPNQANINDVQWNDVGEVVTAFDITAPPGGLIMAWPFSPADDGAEITVYGADINGNPLTQVLSATQNYASALNGPAYWRFFRVTKPVTQGFIGLVLTDGTQVLQTLATYWPQDIEPRYHRIKLQLGPQQQQPKRIRMRYRRRWLKVSALSDVIPLKSRSALTMWARYLIQVKSGQDVQMFAQNSKQVAIDLAEADWRRANPREVMDIQVNTRTFGASFPPVY